MVGGKAISGRLVLAMSLVASIGGCGIYLHDDGLQKQTDAALSTYKSANVDAAVKSTLEAQAEFDKQQLDSELAQDTAFREAELADLIAGRGLPPATRKAGTAPMTSIRALKYRIDNRLRVLGAEDQNPADWQFRHEKVTDAQATYDGQLQLVTIDAGNYTRAGGKGFENCDEPFTTSTGLSAEATSAASKLSSDCSGLEIAKAGVDAANKPLSGLLHGSGLIASVDQTLTSMKTQIKADQQAASNAAAELKKAQSALDSAKTAPTLDAKAIAVLKQADAYLDDADKVAGKLGEDSYSPGAMLEVIKFRKTNLCDVLAANAGRSCSGSTPSTGAATVGNAIGGVVSGIAKLTGIDKPPDTGTLAVALAFQTGLEAVARAQLNGLQMQQKLLTNEEDALSQEVELLLVARSALGKLPARCDGNALGEVMLNKSKGCSEAELDAIAQALAAYNLSWVTGRTTASIDETKRMQVEYMSTLQVAQANATARDGVIVSTLTALDAYGQGGVPPATIASFLQVIAQGVIAKGVN